MRRRRNELRSFGFDDFLQGIGADPAASPDSFGLRVPPFARTEGPIPRYLFLLAVTDLLAGDQIVGLRQYASVGVAVALANPTPLYPVELPITTPGWHPPDAYITWILTLQNLSGQALVSGPVDRESFRFLDAMQPALVYQRAHFPAVPLLPGYLGLDDYAPPSILGTPAVVLRSIQYPWADPTGSTALMRPVTASVRARFYAAVVQRPAASTQTLPAVFSSDPPEDQFLFNRPGSQYWRVAGELDVARAKRDLSTEPTEPGGAT